MRYLSLVLLVVVAIESARAEVNADPSRWGSTPPNCKVVPKSDVSSDVDYMSTSLDELKSLVLSETIRELNGADSEQSIRAAAAKLSRRDHWVGVMTRIESENEEVFLSLWRQAQTSVSRDIKLFEPFSEKLELLYPLELRRMMLLSASEFAQQGDLTLLKARPAVHVQPCFQTARMFPYEFEERDLVTQLKNYPTLALAYNQWSDSLRDAGDDFDRLVESGNYVSKLLRLYPEARPDAERMFEHLRVRFNGSIFSRLDELNQSIQKTNDLFARLHAAFPSDRGFTPTAPQILAQLTEDPNKFVVFGLIAPYADGLGAFAHWGKQRSGDLVVRIAPEVKRFWTGPGSLSDYLTDPFATPQDQANYAIECYWPVQTEINLIGTQP